MQRRARDRGAPLPRVHEQGLSTARFAVLVGASVTGVVVVVLLVLSALADQPGG